MEIFKVAEGNGQTECCMCKTLNWTSFLYKNVLNDCYYCGKCKKEYEKEIKDIPNQFLNKVYIDGLNTTIKLLRSDNIECANKYSKSIKKLREKNAAYKQEIKRLLEVNEKLRRDNERWNYQRNYYKYLVEIHEKDDE